MSINGPYKSSPFYWFPRIGVGGKYQGDRLPAWYSFRWLNLYVSIYS